MSKNESSHLITLSLIIGVIGFFAMMGGKPLENRVEISTLDQEAPSRPLPELLRELKKNPSRSPASLLPLEK